MRDRERKINMKRERKRDRVNAKAYSSFPNSFSFHLIPKGISEQKNKYLHFYLIFFFLSSTSSSSSNDRHFMNSNRERNRIRFSRNRIPTVIAYSRPPDRRTAV